MPYRMPSYEMNENGPQFVSKSFAKGVSPFTWTKEAEKKAIPRKINGKGELFRWTIVASLRQSVVTSENQKEWDMYVQPLTYDLAPRHTE